MNQQRYVIYLVVNGVETLFDSIAYDADIKTGRSFDLNYVSHWCHIYQRDRTDCLFIVKEYVDE